MPSELTEEASAVEATPRIFHFAWADGTVNPARGLDDLVRVTVLGPDDPLHIFRVDVASLMEAQARLIWSMLSRHAWHQPEFCHNIEGKMDLRFELSDIEAAQCEQALYDFMDGLAVTLFAEAAGAASVVRKVRQMANA